MSVATISQGPLSPSQVTAPGFYLEILQPPSYIAGVASNTGAVVGSASWGPVNQPQFCGSPQDVLRQFGAVLGPGAPYSGSLTAPQNKYDLVPEALMAFGESGPAGGLSLWCERVVDGTSSGIATPNTWSPSTGGSEASTAAYASGELVDTVPVTGITLYGKYPGTLGNAIAVTLLAGSKGAPYYTLVVNPPGGLGLSQEVYPNIPAAGPWTHGTPAANSYIIPSNAPGYLFKCTTSGANGSTQPAVWNTAAAGATSDGSAVWTCQGPIPAGLTYPASASSYANLFWSYLQQVISNGYPNVRGPSLLLFAPASGTGAPSTTAVAPSVGANNNTILPSLTSGSLGVDGSSVVGATPYNAAGLAANQIGSQASTPVTGIYALASVNPPVMALRLAGFGETASDTDLTNGLATVQAFCDANAIVHYTGLTIADDTATGTAVANVASLGQDDWEVVYGKDHAYFNDTVNGSRLFPIAAALMGSKLALPPELSPLNIKLKSISQTYRTSPQGQPAPYSNGEIGQCQTGRIALVTNPSPGGPYLGWNTGVNGSSNPAQSPVEYSHMTNYIAKSLAAFFGKWVGGSQGIAGQQPNDPDPIRTGVTADLTNFFQPMLDAKRIAGYSVLCNASINSPTTIAQHFLFAQAVCQYLSSVWFFLMSFTGGTTVQVTVAQGSGS